MSRAKLTFTSRVEQVESNVRGTFNPCVAVPERIVAKLLDEAGKKTVPVQVRGTLNSQPIEANVVKHRGVYRLYLNTQMRQSAGIAVGDTVHFSLSFDPSQRLLPVPKELEAALATNKQAHIVWQNLPPSHRREFLAYLNSLKSKESLDRNIKKTMQILLGEEHKRPF